MKDDKISFILRTCWKRPDRFSYYQRKIEGLIECFDDFVSKLNNSSMLNMKKALQIALSRNTDAVFLEDDIVLCKNFQEKILAEIEKRPNDVIQFFSMRKDDKIIGSRYIPGSKYLMNQCFYCPKNIIEKIYSDYYEFQETRKDNNIGGTDSLVCFTLKKNKLKYWNVCPNLVDHIEGVSAIDKRRSSKRVSFTFKYD